MPENRKETTNKAIIIKNKEGSRVCDVDYKSGKDNPTLIFKNCSIQFSELISEVCNPQNYNRYIQINKK